MVNANPVVNKPVVIKLSGAAVEDAGVIAALMQAVAELHSQQPVVLVHGGGKQVDQHLQQWQLPIVKKDGLRVSPAEQMPIISAVLAGQVNKLLVAAAKQGGLNAVGLSLADGDTAVCLPHADVELGAVGVVKPGQATVLKSLLKAGALVIVSSIAVDGEGQLRNINADDAAVCVASALDAEQLLLLSDVAGVRLANGSYAPSLNGAEIQQLIQDGTISGGMIAKVRAALDAAAALLRPVTIASFLQPGELRRLRSQASFGTTVRR
ncbi:acetylglutamate kinase [Permianibacter sp. IMCC34836]|nr:acetylglutamate kinase [Permianibacter fluminis]